jgi:ribose 5-phosphate isomerase A
MYDASNAAHEKRLAATHALEFVEDGMTVGLGTGSTAAIFVELLGARVREGLRVVGVPTSTKTRELAVACGIELATLDDVAAIDVTVDGADELDGELRLIKGGGGALLYEKLVALASRALVVVADSGKLVERIGRVPLPIEVVPFGWRHTSARVARLGVEPVLRMDAAGAPVRTDEGNLVLDCPFGPIEAPERLAAELKGLPGVVDHGLFLDIASTAIVASASGVDVRDRPPRPTG